MIHLSWSVNTDTILTVSFIGSSDRLGGLCMAQTPEGHASRVHQRHWRHDVPEGPEVLSHVSQSLLHWLPHRLRRNFCMVSHPKREQGEQYEWLMMCQVLILLFYIYRCIKDALLTLTQRSQLSVGQVTKGRDQLLEEKKVTVRHCLIVPVLFWSSTGSSPFYTWLLICDNIS